MKHHSQGLTRFDSGSWSIARLTSGDMQVLTWIFIFISAARGFDYTTGSDSTGSDSTGNTLSAIESFAHLEIWGAAFLIGAICLAVGVATSRHAFVYLGHSVLAVAYTVLTVGICFGAAQNLPWVDGIRSGTVLLAPTAWHWIMWWRTGPTPLKICGSAPDEVIGRPV